MDTIIFAINAILPIILVIGLGYILGRTKIFDKHFINVGDRFVFLVALPLLLFTNIYQIDSIDQIDWPLVLYSVIMIFVIFFISLITVLIFTKDEKQKGVILAAGFRSNYAILGIPIATMIAANGLVSQTVAMATVIGLVTIPLFNVLAVISLTMFIKNNDGSKISFKQVLKRIITNPLIIGIIVGFVFVLLRPYSSWSLEYDFSGLYKAITMIATIASPLALLILGADFTFEEVKNIRGQLIHGLLLRSLMTPILGLGIAVILTNLGVVDFTTVHFPGLVGLFSAPIAVSSVVMSKQMDNDHHLAGQLVVWSTIISIAVVFISVVLLRLGGFI